MLEITPYKRCFLFLIRLFFAVFSSLKMYEVGYQKNVGIRSATSYFTFVCVLFLSFSILDRKNLNNSLLFCLFII